MKKRAAPLGQHLLTNTKHADTVARASGARRGMCALEIGPGTGILTRALLTLGARVVAVEKDPRMVVVLKELFAKEIRNKKLVLIEGDARDVLRSAHSVLPERYVVAANIPYYITGELLRLLLTAERQPQQVALLVQKEVAERIARSKKESILSLSVKVYGAPRYVATVTRGNFNPPPAVDSAILAITDISRKHFAAVSEEKFFSIVKVGFAQKRKTLAGNLRRAFGHDGGVAPGVRAEDVPLAEWLRLSACTSDSSKKSGSP